MNRRDYRQIALTMYAAVAVCCAIAVPRFLLAGDSWLDASRFVRAQAQPGDLVILPANRLERLPAFHGTWAVAADAVSVPAIGRFRRIFSIGDRDAPPLAGLTVLATRRFGTLKVQLCARR